MTIVHFELLVTMVPLAIVIGLSPLPILPAILLLMTPRVRANAVAYLVSWLLALTAIVIVVAAISDATVAADDELTTSEVSWIQLVTGVVFVAMAGWKWFRSKTTPKRQPKWAATIANYRPKQAALLGAALAGLNPKNLIMAIAAGAEIALLSSSAAMSAAAIVVFVLVGSIGVLVPIGSFLILGDRARPALDRAQEWLDRNSTVLSMGVLLILGILLILKAL